MKKTLSVFLAVILTLMCAAPVFAAAPTQTVTFHGASADLDDLSISEPAYYFVQYENGDIKGFHEDPTLAPDEGYVWNNFEGADGKFYYYQNILFDDDKAKFEGRPRYMPDQYSGTVEIPDGEIFSFKVFTNAKYDIATVVVTVNGEILEPNENGEYSLIADRTLDIRVREKFNGDDILLRSRFSVTLVSGEGYSVKTRKNENNRDVFYGETFRFRVKVAKGYVGTNMKVKVIPANGELFEFLGEDADMFMQFLDKSDPLTCVGTDEDGCYLFETPAITQNVRIIVSEVREESKSGIMATLKRILRMILNLFGISAPFLDDIVSFKNVTVDASSAEAQGITYEPAVKDGEVSPTGTYSVMTGEGFSMKLIKKYEEQNVRVFVKRGSDAEAVETEFPLQWTAHFNRSTGETRWTAVCFVNNVSEDTFIRVEA